MLIPDKYSSEIISNSANYAADIFKNQLNKDFVYHNIYHTNQVIEDAIEIAENMKVNSDEIEILILSAIFHDIGYIESAKNNEPIGARIAEEFLLTQNYPNDKINLVKSCIMATQMPQHPKSYLDEIMCDADLLSVGKERFLLRTLLLKKEVENLSNNEMDNDKWFESTIDFFEKQKFWTSYCSEKYTTLKERNILILKSLIQTNKNLNDNKDDFSLISNLFIKDEVAQSKKKKNKKNKTESIEISQVDDKSIDSMYRSTMRGHLILSQIADDKSNFMLSINSIIFSVIITYIFPNIKNYNYILFPLVFLMIVVLTTIVFAILSTRPKITKGEFSNEEIKHKKVNLLFFGNFHKMDLDTYNWGMKEMIKDKEYLHNSMIKDIYYLGKVLSRKYKYLSITYNVFMYGIILSVIIFLIQLYLNH